MRTPMIESTAGWSRQAFRRTAPPVRSNNYINHVHVAALRRAGKYGGTVSFNYDIGRVDAAQPPLRRVLQRAVLRRLVRVSRPTTTRPTPTSWCPRTGDSTCRSRWPGSGRSRTSSGHSAAGRIRIVVAERTRSGDRLMTKVLVTGGAGFIGSNFVRYALQTPSRLACHHSRQADLRRPQGEPARRDGQSAPHVRARRHLRCGDRRAAGRSVRLRGALRRRNPCRPLDHGRRRFHQDRRRGLVRAARSGAPQSER